MGPPYQANTTVQHGQNSVKQWPNSAKQCQRLHRNDELHQKDLRINVDFMHILGPENERVLRADMFLALSLIVSIYVPGPSFNRRRVDIQYPRPCQYLINSQFMDY